MGNQEILQKIRDGVYKLAHKRKGKSEIWDLFAEVRKDDDSILDGYLCCRKCIRLYRFDGRGTSNLNRHKCYSSISRVANIEDSNFATNGNFSADEDGEASNFIETLDGRDEVDDIEAPPLRRRSLRFNSNVNIKESTHLTKSLRAKQMENLCELLKSDLEELPEEHCTGTSNAMQEKAENRLQECETYIQLDVDDILHNINSGVYKLTQKRGGKSKIWDIFAEIRKDDNSVLEGYLCCLKCTRLFRFDGIRTSNLNRHKCYSSISKASSFDDSNVALNEHSSTVEESDNFDEDLKASYSIAPLDAHHKLQKREYPPNKQLIYGNSIRKSELSKNFTIQSRIARGYAEKVESFCEVLKSDMEDILQNIHIGVYTLSQKRKGKSKIWNIFAEIRKDDNTVLDGYLCCRKCIRLYRFDGRRTSNLNRHKCYSSISNMASIDDTYFELTKNSSSNCDDENVRAHDPLATSNDELQDCETSPRKQRLCRVGGASDVKLPKCPITTRYRRHKFEKQVHSLCEMIKSDLQNLPEELFYNAKWKIMDVLRDVHRAKLENKCQPRVFSAEKRESATGIRINAGPSIAVSSSAAAPKALGNVIEFLAQ